MAKKVLVINSDIASNRGDRAIIEGVIELIKQRFPDSEMTALSEHARRDKKWLGINILPQNIHSLNPLDLIKLLVAAKKSDIIFWGGGEMLKDYTNKASLWYWVIKMTLVSVINSNVYGMYQGIGPTSTKSSRKMVRFIVERCKAFGVRDEESLEKLLAWGCSPEKVVLGADPAVLGDSGTLKTQLTIKLAQAKLTSSKLSNSVIIAPRNWFHYRRSGILPYKYRRLFSLKKQDVNMNEEHQLFLNRLEFILNEVIKLGYNVTLLPMHMSEEDIKLCRRLKKSIKGSDKVFVLDKDIFSSNEIRTIISKAKAVIGFRLHSTIIATSSAVPSLNYYYVDKGRAYFKLISQQDHAHPIESLLESDFEKAFRKDFKDLLAKRDSISKALKKTNTRIKEELQVSFNDMVSKNE